jgi:hypothetical protein
MRSRGQYTKPGERDGGRERGNYRRPTGGYQRRDGEEKKQ